ncbi:MAG: helix-turn-helix domain-containing protein [Sphingomonadaceae bacterium]
MLLSRTYAPSPGLEPYIRRHYVFDAHLPDDFEIIDGVLGENSFIRILVRGDWTAELSPGKWSFPSPVVLCGPNSGPVRVRVRGPFRVVGFAIRPSGWRSMFWESTRSFVDQMVPLAQSWGELAQRLEADIRAAVSDEEIVAAMEAVIVEQMERTGHRSPDEQMASFEAIARTDSTIRVDDAAARLGMSVRQLERRCLATFGLTPKMILRRSRFLDMAAAMRGFSSPTEEQLAALRYSDQSHLNREFRRFVGMTPGVFANSATPLLTANLKLRAEGKVLI